MNQDGASGKPPAATASRRQTALAPRRLAGLAPTIVTAGFFAMVATAWAEDPKPAATPPPAAATPPPAAATPPPAAATPTPAAVALESPPPKLSRLAKRLVRQLDRNGDGRLEPAECLGTSGNAIGQAWAAVDVDADGEVTVEELAGWLSGYAKTHPLRVGSTGQGDDRGTGTVAGANPPGGPESGVAGADGIGSPPGSAQATPRPGGTAKFAVAKRRLPAGLPPWFLEQDADGDGQLTLLEFSPRATPADVAAFRRYDLNGDGLVTPKEYLAVTKPAAKKTAKEEKGDTAKSKAKTRTKSGAKGKEADAKADATTDAKTDAKADAAH